LLELAELKSALRVGSRQTGVDRSFTMSRRQPISTFGNDDGGFAYRGLDVRALTLDHDFDDVVHLLIEGSLPDAEERAGRTTRLGALREPPAGLVHALDRLPPRAHASHRLVRTRATLSDLEPAESPDCTRRIGNRLIGLLPYALASSASRGAVRQRCGATDESTSGYLLRLLTGTRPSTEARRCLDAVLSLYADHELDRATLAARRTASLDPDCYAAIGSAMGVLRTEPFHRTAGAAGALLDKFATADEAASGVKDSLRAGASIPGFGHHVYRFSDPRGEAILEWASLLAPRHGRQNLLRIAERIEDVVWRGAKQPPNIHFFAALACRICAIPSELITPVLTIARVAGWTAHVLEEQSRDCSVRVRTRKQWVVLPARACD
jgi:2-methylcitrate synthase